MRPSARAHDYKVNAIPGCFTDYRGAGVVAIDDQTLPIESSQVSRTRMFLQRLPDCLSCFLVDIWCCQPDTSGVAMQKNQFGVICSRQGYRISQSLIGIGR